MAAYELHARAEPVCMAVRCGHAQRKMGGDVDRAYMPMWQTKATTKNDRASIGDDFLFSREHNARVAILGRARRMLGGHQGR